MRWMSIDLRVDTGGRDVDESAEVPEGTFLAPLAVDGDVAIAEVRFLWHGREVSLVAQLTGRSGVRELTPQVLRECRASPGTRDQVLNYLGALAA